MADKGGGVTDTGQTIAQGEKKQTVKRAEFGRLQDSALSHAKPSEHFYFHLFLPDSVVQCGECCISPVHFLEKLSTKSSQGNIARSKQRMKHSIELSIEHTLPMKHRQNFQMNNFHVNATLHSNWTFTK